MYPIPCLRCNLCDVSLHATIIYPRICRFSSALLPFDPGIHIVHRSSSSNRPFAPETPTSCCFLIWKGEYISRTQFKERSRSSKKKHYCPNMLQILRANLSVKDSLNAEGSIKDPLELLL
ncbi:hypothetical protein KP509_27G055700 [Ceratopteris richardii]|uniref:Uncharacterized protein n=1 Tax=Ceratopteris richardii TaxID=49495 RepID=A0A8T2RJ68_CERRI|nr:hypothetical protein KP509_27G055700 [Ceratopteris richardii]